jgi:hypothetical protein
MRSSRFAQGVRALWRACVWPKGTLNVSALIQPNCGSRYLCRIARFPELGPGGPVVTTPTLLTSLDNSVKGALTDGNVTKGFRRRVSRAEADGR